MLEIDNLTIKLGANTLHYHQNIDTANIVTLQGVSGVGKSSLLLCIAGFIPIVSGDIRWQGQSIATQPAEQRPVAMLFQENNLFEHLSVRDNIKLGGVIDDHEILAAAQTLLIEQQLDKAPNELSGGQRQRVALLRTLLRPEAIILLDEPFAELDNQSRSTAANWVADIAKKNKKTLLLVTHQAEDVTLLAHKNWLIQAC